MAWQKRHLRHLNTLRNEPDQRLNVLRKLASEDIFKRTAATVLEAGCAVLDPASPQDDYVAVSKQAVHLLDRHARYTAVEKKFNTYALFLRSVFTTAWKDRVNSSAAFREQFLDRIGRNKALKAHVFNKLSNFRNEITVQKQEDIYQDTLIKIIPVIRKGDYQGGSLRAMFGDYAINLLRNDIRKDQKMQLEEFPTDDSGQAIPLLDRLPFEQEEANDLFYAAFGELSLFCKSLFYKIYYYEVRPSAKNIADMMDRSSAAVIGNDHLKCKDELRELYQENIKRHER